MIMWSQVLTFYLVTQAFLLNILSSGIRNLKCIYDINNAQVDEKALTRDSCALVQSCIGYLGVSVKKVFSHYPGTWSVNGVIRVYIIVEEKLLCMISVPREHVLCSK